MEEKFVDIIKEFILSNDDLGNYFSAEGEDNKVSIDRTLINLELLLDRSEKITGIHEKHKLIDDFKTLLSFLKNNAECNTEIKNFLSSKENFGRIVGSVNRALNLEHLNSDRSDYSFETFFGAILDYIEESTVLYDHNEQTAPLRPVTLEEEKKKRVLLPIKERIFVSLYLDEMLDVINKIIFKKEAKKKKNPAPVITKCSDEISKPTDADLKYLTMWEENLELSESDYEKMIENIGTIQKEINGLGWLKLAINYCKDSIHEIDMPHSISFKFLDIKNIDPIDIDYLHLSQVIKIIKNLSGEREVEETIKITTGAETGSGAGSGAGAGAGSGAGTGAGTGAGSGAGAGAGAEAEAGLASHASIKEDEEEAYASSVSSYTYSSGEGSEPEPETELKPLATTSLSSTTRKSPTLK